MRGTKDGIRPYIFKTLVGRGHPGFETKEQQDTSEYWRYLLDKIKAEEKKAKASDPGKIFEFELEKRT